MNYPVVYTRKVRFSDSDIQGHVFNANYVVYFDDAITDYMDAAGLPYSEITARGHDMVLARVECDYRSPGVLGESLEVGVGVERVGNTSLVFGLRIREAAEKRVIAEGKEIYVILDHATHRPTQVPDYMREAVGRLQGSEA
jgi:acyl-CoA thioester hydrolase